MINFSSKKNSLSKGFSLLELIVMLGVMAMIITPIMRLFTSSIKTSKYSANLYKSINMASSYMVALRGIDDEKFTALSKIRADSAPVPFNTSSREVNYNENILEPYITIEKCGTEDNYNLFKIIVEVLSVEKKEKSPYKLCSIVLVKKI